MKRKCKNMIPVKKKKKLTCLLVAQRACTLLANNCWRYCSYEVFPLSEAVQK